MWVIKVGGSLAAGATLRDWLACIAADERQRWLLVPGGGPYADAVREQQRIWHFNDADAHDMALQAMALYARQLHALVPALPVLASPLDFASRAGHAIWLPAAGACSFLKTLPENWSTTSDSIALCLAQQLNAEGLVLLKSSPAPVVPAFATRLALASYLDPLFPQLLRAQSLPVYCVDGSKGSQVIAWSSQCAAREGVRVLPD
jgi:aspartokinase-like uncharacterized kinase